MALKNSRKQIENRLQQRQRGWLPVRSPPVTLCLSGVRAQTRQERFPLSALVHTLVKSAPLIRHLLYSLSSILGGVCDLPTEGRSRLGAYPPPVQQPHASHDSREILFQSYYSLSDLSSADLSFPPRWHDGERFIGFICRRREVVWSWTPHAVQTSDI